MEERRKSSVSSLDPERLAKLQQLKAFQKGSLASKLLKLKSNISGADESAAAAISLSKVMARKKGAEVSLQIEIENEAQWKLLLRREGLTVVEVYSGWCGPCLSMVQILKKVKVDANDDRLTLATINSDVVPELRIFKDQSEPAWIFFGSGKPVRLMRGTNAPKIVSTVKEEFQHELLCLEGKAKRNLISIKDEAERLLTARDEAVKLAVRQKAAEKERKIKPPPPPPTPKPQSPTEEKANEEETRDEGGEEEEEEREEQVPVEDEPIPYLDYDKEAEDAAALVRAAEEAAEARLQTKLEPYTVLCLENYLLETGAVTELKDHIKDEFNLLMERYISLDEAGVRRLFSIPYEIEELIEEEEEEEEEVEEDGEEEERASGVSERGSEAEGSQSQGDGRSEVSESEREEEKKKEPRYRSVPVPLPAELVGPTLLFLLQHEEVSREREEDPEATLAKTADDFLKLRLGPESYTEAAELEPKSLVAVYGREEYAVGVWCPRQYEEKKFVLLSYFPQFVADLLLPPPKELPKYMVAIFPALFSHEIMEQPELVSNCKDVVAQGTMTLSPNFVDRILKSKGLAGEDLDAQRRALTGFDMFVISIDERNQELVQALIQLEPIHYSVNSEQGMKEAAKLFPHLNILVEQEEEEEFFSKELIIERFLARPKLNLQAIFGDDEEDGF